VGLHAASAVGRGTPIEREEEWEEEDDDEEERGEDAGEGVEGIEADTEEEEEEADEGEEEEEEEEPDEDQEELMHQEELRSMHMLAEQLAVEVRSRQGRLPRLLDTPAALQLATAIEALGCAGLHHQQQQQHPQNSGSGTVVGEEGEEGGGQPTLLLHRSHVHCHSGSAAPDVGSSASPGSSGTAPQALGSIERLAVRACAVWCCCHLASLVADAAAAGQALLLLD